MKVNIKNTLILSLLSVLIFAGAIGSGSMICKQQMVSLCHTVKAPCNQVEQSKKTHKTAFNQPSCMTYIKNLPVTMTLRDGTTLAEVDMLVSEEGVTYRNSYKALKYFYLSAFKDPFQSGPLYLVNLQFIL